MLGANVRLCKGGSPKKKGKGRFEVLRGTELPEKLTMREFETENFSKRELIYGVNYHVDPRSQS